MSIMPQDPDSKTDSPEVIPLTAATAGALRTPRDVGRYVRFLLTERSTEQLIDGRIVRADQGTYATRLILDDHEAIFWIASHHRIAVGP